MYARIPRYPRCIAIAFTALVEALVATASPPLRAFTVNETQVSSEPVLLDPEFNQADALTVWVDASGKLWVAQIDRNTGKLVPSDGRGQLVDGDAMSTADLATYNGPEWISTARGEEIVYTKFVAGQPHTAVNARLATAARDAQGAWSVRFLAPDQVARAAPYASNNPGDPAPAISYIDAQQNHYWRYLDVPTSEQLIGRMPATLSLRFARGEASMPLPARAPDGRMQVFRLWLATGLREQLTFDDGHDNSYDATWLWSAPEYGGEMLLGVLSSGNNEFRVYRKLLPADTAWSVIYRAVAPLSGRFGSMEPFTYNGRSYAMMTWAPPTAAYGTAIFVSNIDAAAPLLRRITPSDNVHSRRDPEVFITATGPRVYFNRYNSNSRTCMLCAPEGVWMADPGLP